jgi:hypothetical protein
MNSNCCGQYALAPRFMLNSINKTAFYLIFCCINLCVYTNNVFATQITWTGATNRDWNIASNWSPATVPTVTDEAVIDNSSNEPVIHNGTSEVKLISLNTNAILTVSSGATLNVRGNNSFAINIREGSLVNNGTINIQTAANGSVFTGIYFFDVNSRITNNGTLLINASNISIYSDVWATTVSITNSATGTITFIGGGIGIQLLNSSTTFSNSGTINYTGSTDAIQIYSASFTFDNYGTMNLNVNGARSIYLKEPGNTFINRVCGTIITDGFILNKATFTNLGLVQSSTSLLNTGIFNANGVTKFSDIQGAGTFTNNKLLVNNNPTPIFSYGAGFNMTVDGIYKNAAATNSAGTFVAPNSFTPSGLALGMRTLYAKITANGGACTYIVPFTYDVALPVELMDFKGQNIEVRNPDKLGTERGNLLIWTTATELNNKGFQIEKQNATEDRWDILGFVNGNNKASTYTFTDNNPHITSYYRLRQIDNDGTETVSKIISISNKNKNALKAYPSVSNGFLAIETSDNVDFQVFNLLGQQTRSGRFETSPTFMDISALPQGTYILKVGTEQVKFFKQ